MHHGRFGRLIASCAAIFVFGACGNSSPEGAEASDASSEARDAAPRPTEDAGMDIDAGPPAAPVRFVAMGDTGTGSPDQYAVGNAIADLCASRGCDFVVLLGDNFYDAGVDGLSDPLWQEYFEEPYAAIPDSIPFYPVLGNHDYGGTLLFQEFGGLGNEFDKGAFEVGYSDLSAKWTMPATHYTLRVGNVGFMMLDTNSIMWDDTSNGDQEAWYAAARAELDGADWVFAAGHHPYRSNGRHGNAGSYESIEVLDIPIDNPVPLLNGGDVKAFFDTHVCGTIDAYFCGHDHNRQLLDEPDALCGAELIVSGAGAKVTSLESTSNATLFEDDTTPGFAYVVVDGDELTIEFVDSAGTVEFIHNTSKRRDTRRAKKN